MATNTCPNCGYVTITNNSANTAYKCLECQQQAFLQPFKITNQTIPTGWVCPRCQKVHSPYYTFCDCQPKPFTSSSVICRKCNMAVCTCGYEVKIEENDTKETI